MVACFLFFFFLKSLSRYWEEWKAPLIKLQGQKFVMAPLGQTQYCKYGNNVNSQTQYSTMYKKRIVCLISSSAIYCCYYLLLLIYTRSFLYIGFDVYLCWQVALIPIPAAVSVNRGALGSCVVFGPCRSQCKIDLQFFGTLAFTPSSSKC